MKALTHTHSDHLHTNPKLHSAVLASNVTKVREYCSKADSIYTIDDLNTAGLAAIHLAIKTKSEELVNLLLEAGANPNQATAQGKSPLILAITEGTPTILARLIEGEANLNQTDNDGNSPLKIATDLKKDECTEILREHGAVFTGNKARSSVTTTPAAATAAYVGGIIGAVEIATKNSAKFISFKEFSDRVLSCTEEYIKLPKHFSPKLKSDLEHALNEIFDNMMRNTTTSQANPQRNCHNFSRKIIAAIHSHIKPHLLKLGEHTAAYMMGSAESAIEDKIVKAKSGYSR